MLTKLVTMSHAKVLVVFLVGLMLLTSCGGGGEDTSDGNETVKPVEPPDEVMLSLSELTQDTSQGKAIIVDYQGPAFDEDDLRISVGDTPVESVFVNDQIYLLLPLTQLGRASVAFDFGDFSSSLYLDIPPAPVIADPPAYVSSLVEDLVADLDAFSEGDWEDEIEALYAAEQELSNLSTAEIRELAVFLKQNVEPALLDLNSPVVAQVDKADCDRSMRRFAGLSVALGVQIYGFAAYLVIPEPSKLAGVVIGGAALLYVVRAARDAAGQVWADCVHTGIEDIRADIDALTTQVQVAQQSPGMISTIQFDAGEPRGISISLQRKLVDEVRTEFVRAAQDLGDGLQKISNGLHYASDLFPRLSRWSGIDAFIAKFDGFISRFAGLENPERVEAVDHAGFRLEGISDRNITGSITDAGPERLFLEFNFGDRTTVPQDGCVDFDFTLSNSRAGLEDVNVPGRLCASEEDSEATIVADTSSVMEGMSATFTVTFDPAPAWSITLNYTVTQSGNYVPSDELGNKTLRVSSGTAAATITVTTEDDQTIEDDGTVSVVLSDATGYTVGTPGGVELTANDDDMNNVFPIDLCTTCEGSVQIPLNGGSYQLDGWTVGVATTSIASTRRMNLFLRGDFVGPDSNKPFTFQNSNFRITFYDNELSYVLHLHSSSFSWYTRNLSITDAERIEYYHFVWSE